MPKENVHYTCIAYIIIDSVMRMEKKVIHSLLEECKYKIKKTKVTNFINTELEWESELESNSKSELESDTELELKVDFE